MTTQKILYFNELDSLTGDKYIAVPSNDITKENFSLLDLNAYPLFENNKQIGIITRYVTDIYLENNNKYYQVYYYTIFFDNTNDSINFNFTFITDPTNGGTFPANVPINCVITSCSGSIFDKNGTIEFLPLKFDPTIIMITINLY